MARLFGVEALEVAQEQDQTMVFAEGVDTAKECLPSLVALDRGDRSGLRLGFRQGDDLPLLCPPVVPQVADAVLDDAAQPAAEGTIVRVIEGREISVSGQVSILEDITAFDDGPSRGPRRARMNMRVRSE